MPKIPTTQQTVSTQTPRVANYQIPGPVRGAFGENVTAATSKLIEGIGDIGQMFQQQADQMYKVKNAELENEFILGNQDILHNDRTKVVKIDGVDTEIPDGIGDRIGFQAEGSEAEYEKRSADLRDGILKKQPHGGYRTELTQRLGSHWLSTRKTVGQHQVAETRKAAKDTFDALSKTLVESVKADPATLGLTIDKIIKNHLDERNRLGTPLAQMDLEVNEDIAKAAFNAADTKLQAGGSLKEAKAFINQEQVRKKIPKEKYNELIEDLEVSSRRIRSLKDWEIKQANIQGAFDLSQGLLDGTLTPAQIRQGQREGRWTSEVAAIFDTVLTKGEYLIPETTALGKPEYFLRLLDASLDDKTEVMKILKDATIAYGRKEMGANQYAWFIQEAKKKFERQNKGWFGLDKTSQTYRTSVLGIKNFATVLFGVGDPQAGEYEMLNALMERTQKGQAPEIAATEIIEEKLNKEINEIRMTIPSLPKFNSVEEAEAANLAPGSEIMIKGRRAIIE